jgi:hypothetical protein
VCVTLLGQTVSHLPIVLRKKRFSTSAARYFVEASRIFGALVSRRALKGMQIMFKPPIGTCISRGSHKCLRSSSLVVRPIPTTGLPLSSLSVAIADTQIAIRRHVIGPSEAWLSNTNIRTANHSIHVLTSPGQTESSSTFVATQVIAGNYCLSAEAPRLATATLHDLVATTSQLPSLNIST